MTGAAGGTAPWWRQAVVYQVYPRSFADADGDGVGDLAGVTSRVPYLRSLGVDAVWLSPFYPSALADGGYDVDDHRAVDPRLGTLADLDAMVAALHAAGIKVVVDVVPNHTSDRHRWFRDALAAGRGSPERDRYVFRDGRGPDGALPPSGWQSVFGGPAWERVADGQWYLHLFAPEQPDLNWADPDVREDLLQTLRFWADRGVDGFRVDVAHGLVKDVDGHLEVELDPAEPPRSDGSHPFWDRDDLQHVYAEWRQVLDAYDPPRSAVAEAAVHPERRSMYANPRSLDQAFNFDLFEAAWDAAAVRAAIDRGLEQARRGSSATWTLSNHDSVRHATRFGLPPQEGLSSQVGAKAWVTTDGTHPVVDWELGLRRARAAVLLELALPGATYLYQGEELGLHEVADLPAEVLRDPLARRSGGREKGRDGCRVPLPWTPDPPSFGFGGSPTWLPQPPWFADVSVQRQELDPWSTLSLYRTALALRRRLLTDESLTWVGDDPDVLHLARPGGWHSVTNLGAAPVGLPSGELLLSSDPVGDGLTLRPDTTAWVRVG
ncbi:glycoside hydrolase family 13 protein [Thalassiella azotivora]